ncbi:hypothetical protein DLM75_16995 [Leptospira stimsonii]|uniref:Uncharacterized protein n=1 Tax=Leptospira stimsonii TaxID=2202203 RepID=A0A396YX99_9LEPT|nr:hypothetical protein DLM75_16995 [Leptospira stimsonii]
MNFSNILFIRSYVRFSGLLFGFLESEFPNAPGPRSEKTSFLFRNTVKISLVFRLRNPMKPSIFIRTELTSTSGY